METYDFGGWATRNNLLCSDGRTIMANAFSGCDGKTVPLVWNHDHSGAENVLGHALLENRNDGVYAYGSFNDTQMGRHAKALIQHGDITSLSIFANKLKQIGNHVQHGEIREVSLVLAGANPGAYIETVMAHSDDGDEDSGIIFTGMSIEDGSENVIEHKENPVEEKGDKDVAEKTNNEKSIKEIFETLTDEQKDAVYALVGMAIEKEKNNKGADESMEHNVFEGAGNVYTGTGMTDNYISHDEIAACVKDANRYGSLKESFLQHGIENLEYLFPEPKNVSDRGLEWINIKTEWVPIVMNGVHKNPFSRIKTQFADITGDEARALGYIKGKYKKEEVFTLLKRTTQPTTVYKKQKFDRDDIVDITEYEVINEVKTEMRGKLNEELARAFLIGDGRSTSSDDHINDSCIRPIWTDEDLFTIKYLLTDNKPQTFIRGAIKSRIDYRGSGSPILFISEDKLTDMLLMTDATGRDLYDSEQKLATKMRVSKIVTLPQLSNVLTRTDDKTGKIYQLHGLIVNLADYSVGADKGGAVTMFDDFDIDYNKMIYLIETRCSGALTKPYSAIALETEVAANPAQQGE